MFHYYYLKPEQEALGGKAARLPVARDCRLFRRLDLVGAGLRPAARVLALRTKESGHRLDGFGDSLDPQCRHYATVPSDCRPAFRSG